MNICDRYCFIPNSSRKCTQYYVNTHINPFNSLSLIVDSNNKYTTFIHDYILYIKLKNCKKHRILSFNINVDACQNIWRILEIIHFSFLSYYNKLPKFWKILLSEFETKKINKGITNEINGKNKIYKLCYTALKYTYNFIVNNIDENNFIYIDYNINWFDIYDLFDKILKKFIIYNTNICICNDYIDYNKYNFLIKNPNLILNNVQINYNYENFMQNYVNDLNTYINQTKEMITPINTILIQNLYYDMLHEDLKILYIKKCIEREVNNNYNIIINNHIITRKLNTCFVCDADINTYNINIHIKFKEITEVFDNGNVVILPIIYRCHNCKLQKYGSLFKSNKQCILARHYKWMIFYNALYDNYSILQYIPKEIITYIISLYTQIRNL